MPFQAQMSLVAVTLCLMMFTASCRQPCHKSPPMRKSPARRKSPPPRSPPPQNMSPPFPAPSPVPLGVCAANNSTGRLVCPFDMNSQSTTSLWRNCIHDVRGRCGASGSTGRVSAQPNDNSACSNCQIWPCAQNPTLPLMIAGVPFNFMLNTSCRANVLIYNPPRDGLLAFGVMRGVIPTYNDDHFLVMPSTPIWGVDDPLKMSYDFLWGQAWELRSLTQVALGQWAIAINSRRARGQQHMHIHTGVMVVGNRARINAINGTAANSSIQLLTQDGREVVARVIALNATATSPTELRPFTSLPVNPAPPLTANNPNADRGLLVATGPNNLGFVLLDVGNAPVDGSGGFLINT